MSPEKNSGRWRMVRSPRVTGFCSRLAVRIMVWNSLRLRMIRLKTRALPAPIPSSSPSTSRRCRMMLSRSMSLGQTATQARQPMQARTSSAAFSRPWKKAVRMMPMAPM